MTKNRSDDRRRRLSSVLHRMCTMRLHHYMHVLGCQSVSVVPFLVESLRRLDDGFLLPKHVTVALARQLLLLSKLPSIVVFE